MDFHKEQFYQNMLLECEEDEAEEVSSGWKIAFADFMTMLMCLFLMLWLQSADLKVRQEVAKGYNEVGQAQIGEQKAGILDNDAMSVMTSQNNSIVDLITQTATQMNFKQFKVQKIKDGVKLTFGDSFFESGSSDFTEKAQEELESLFFSLISQQPDYFKFKVIEIYGNTDNIPVMAGEYEDNWDLAAKRAIHTLNLIENAGIEPADFKIVSQGALHPVATNKTAIGREQNRRVDVYIKTAH